MALVAVVVATAAAFYVVSPIAFQKASAVRVGPEPEIDWSNESPVMEARRVIGSIPYSTTEVVFDVLPADVYEATMLNGRGNCANKCRGLSIFLLRAGVPFHRVEILPVDGFLYGQGHVLVRTKYELDGVTRVGLIDVLEGSYLVFKGQPVDLAELRVATPFSIAMVPLSALADGTSDYYGTFLNDVAIATVDPGETQRYFRFIEAVYVPFGQKRLERLLYNALAVVFGYFPSAHVTQAEYDRLFAGRGMVLFGAALLRWTTRLLVVLLPIVVLERSIRLARRLKRSVGLTRSTTMTG